MLKLLASIFAGTPRAEPTVDQTVIARAIERLVDGTDPRLRTLPGYKTKLRAAVETSAAYVIDMVGTLRGPVVVGPRDYRNDPRLGAMFASPAHVQEVLGESVPLQQFLASTRGPRPPAVFAALGVSHEKRRTFGAKMVGETVHRDVERTLVNFSAHRLAAPATDETAMRFELMRKAYDHLVNAVLEGFLAQRKDKERLERDVKLLRSKREALRAGHWGMAGVLDPEDDAPLEAARVESELTRIESEIAELGAPTETLERLVGLAVSTLGEPEQYLRLETVTLRVDAMGYEAEDADADSVPTIELEGVAAPDGRRVDIVLVEIPTSVIPSRDELLQRARKTL